VDHPRISRARQTISVLFDNRANDPSGEVPFYDQETIDPFAAARRVTRFGLLAIRAHPTKVQTSGRTGPGRIAGNVIS
jgi:hypothetical protein